MSSRVDGGSDSVARPSREEIESLCILYVVSTGSRTAGELATGLGLSQDVSSAIEEAIAPLIEAGWLEVVAELVRATEAGRARLKSRLSELGVL